MQMDCRLHIHSLLPTGASHVRKQYEISAAVMQSQNKMGSEMPGVCMRTGEPTRALDHAECIEHAHCSLVHARLCAYAVGRGPFSAFFRTASKLKLLVCLRLCLEEGS